MKAVRLFVAVALMGLTATAQAQQEGEKREITSVNDIVNEQQKATTLNDTERHFSNVWGRSGYFNLNWVGGETMTPKELVLTGVGTTGVDKLESDWGVALGLGVNIGLHKRPIANTVKINIDIAGDLTAVHYAPVNGGAYDSSNHPQSDHFYTPWNLDAYRFQLGLGVGPSVTVAPFTSLSAEGLHFMKLNVYYHFGYQGSILMRSSEEKDDVALQAPAPLPPSVTQGNKKFNDMGTFGLASFTHGFTNTFGLNLSWKVIGLGYEYSTCTSKYKAIDGSVHDQGTKFKVGTNRFYVQFRF